MIINMNAEATSKDIDILLSYIETFGCKPIPSFGQVVTVISVTGDASMIDPKTIKAFDNVEQVVVIEEPYKLSNRKFNSVDTVVEVNGVKIGGGNIPIIAGPCSVESEEQMMEIASRVKDAGASMLRGGAFKPRTSPYAFQGLELKGLELLAKAGKRFDMPIVSELLNLDFLDEFVELVDVIQIGARNMQNYDLLKKVGKTNKPILLKRGLSATYEEWLMSAEYIMAQGNPNVILCERGIRTFETQTRNTLDLQSIPVIKRLSHLPIIVDPSHAGGQWWLVEPMAKAAIVSGCDGLMIEVHNDPSVALCDGQQSLKLCKFDNLMGSIRKLIRIL